MTASNKRRGGEKGSYVHVLMNVRSQIKAGSLIDAQTVKTQVCRPKAHTYTQNYA